MILGDVELRKKEEGGQRYIPHQLLLPNRRVFEDGRFHAGPALALPKAPRSLPVRATVVHG